MALKHDEQGFLAGSRLSMDETSEYLESIRDELRAIRKDISTDSRGAAPKSPGSAPARDYGTLSPAARGANSPERDEVMVRVEVDSAEKGGKPTTATPSPTATPDAATGSRATRAAITPVAQPSQRDSRGRFIGGNVATPSANDGGGDKVSMAVDGMGQRLSSAVQEMGTSSEESDPTVKAFNEVTQPLSRGVGKIMGNGEDRKQERWYRRFWSMMRGSRREDRAADKRQQRILKNIERKPVGDGGGSMLWRGILLLLAPITGMLSLLGGLPVALAGAVIAGLKGLLTAIGLGGAAVRIPTPGRSRDGRRRTASPGQPSTRADRQHSQAGSGATSGGSSRSGGIGGALKQGARRLPGVGALLGLGFMANDIASSERSDATREEKNVTTGRAAGRGVGGLGGMAGGAAAGATLGSVVPVIGTAVGGIVGAIAGGYFGGEAGEVLGEKAGQWLNTMKDSSLFQGMADSWHYASDITSSLWESTTDTVSSNWKSVTDRWDGVSKTVSDGWGKATDAITDRWEAVTGEMKERWGDAVDLAAKGWDALTDAMGGVNDWIEEKTGVDVGGSLNQLSDAAVEGATSVGNYVSSGLDSAATTVSDASKSAWGSVASGASAVSDWAANTAPGRALRDAKEEASTNLAGRRNARSAEPALMAAMSEAGIADPNEQAAFMGQMHHESGGFTQLEESLYYTPERLQEVWPSRFPDEASTKGFARNPEALGNHVYGGRMGNTEPGDGHRYRGRGFTQLTGRDNYTAASEALGIDLVNNPDMAADPEVAAKVSTWYWQNREGLSEAAQQGDTREVTRLINGGDNGLADREAQTNRYLAAAQAGEYTATPTSQPDTRSSSAGGPSTPRAPTPPVVASYLDTLGLSSRSPALGVSTSSPVSIPPLRVPPVNEAPTVSVPLSQGGSRENQQADSGRHHEDVSRDVSDRRIAHIVTGAYSGMS